MAASPSAASAGIEREGSLVPQVVGTLARCGFKLNKSHFILDFGCGTGRHVAAFRDAGYCAYGVDIKGGLWESCAPDERSWLRLSPNRFIYQIPWPDSSFDVVYSNQVFEHLMHYEPALEEIRRVLKPQGVVINIFPSKWRLIEPHFFCPLGSWLRWWPWIKLWSMVGTACPTLPPGFTRSEKAEINWRTSRTHLAYHSLRELKFLFGLYFGRVRFAEKEFVLATLESSWFSRLINRASKVLPPTLWLYRHLHTKVAILDGYNQPARMVGNYDLY